MNRLIALALLITCSSAHAQPTLSVTHEGVDTNGNNAWVVSVAPDPELFAPGRNGGSLATELAFAVRGSVIEDVAPINRSDWELDNPGNNPFAGTVTEGLVLSGGPNGQETEIFASFGGRIFTSGDLVELFSFTTIGDELTTVDYGTAASGDSIQGTIIAQAGAIFPQGVQTTPLSAQIALSLAPASPTGLFASSGEELMRNGDNFFGYTGSVSSIPEPASMLLIVSTMGIFVGIRRRGMGT